MTFQKNEPESLPNKLLKALVEAKGRGVHVEVFLDQNVDFVAGTPGAVGDPKARNMEAYLYLKENGVKVYLDDPSIYSHSKAIVIDDETVIIGSTNWSNAALTTNKEANVLVRSKDFARQVIADQSKAGPEKPIFDPKTGVPVSWEFTNRVDLIGQMVSQGDERAFDVYLYLLKEYDGNLESKVSLNHDELAKALGIEAMSRDAYRRQILKTLDKLEEEYKSIGVSTSHGKNSEVILKSYEDPARPYVAPQDKYVILPKAYWDYGWGKTLSFPGKVIYLLNLSYSQVSPKSPKWYSTIRTLSERHHISKWFISEGTKALRRADLVEVRYDEVGAKGNPNRLANIYTPNELYDPKEREARFQELEKTYGKEKYTQARDYAKLVYEDKSLSGIKSLLELDAQYGPEIVKKAVGVVSIKNPDNPKRSMGYLISTIKGMAVNTRGNPK